MGTKWRAISSNRNIEDVRETVHIDLRKARTRRAKRPFPEENVEETRIIGRSRGITLAEREIDRKRSCEKYIYDILYKTTFL